eukprot:g7079.t1
MLQASPNRRLTRVRSAMSRQPDPAARLARSQRERSWRSDDAPKNSLCIVTTPLTFQAARLRLKDRAPSNMELRKAPNAPTQAYRSIDTSEIGSLLADTPIPSTNAQDNDDEDHTPLLVPTHENTNIPDSPTHDTEQPQHSESEQQDELSLEQSLQDDSYKQVSIGPTPNSDFTAPDADYTDPNQQELTDVKIYLRPLLFRLTVTLLVSSKAGAPAKPVRLVCSGCLLLSSKFFEVGKEQSARSWLPMEGIED